MSLPAICNWASGGERLAACWQLTGNEITRQALQQIAWGWLRQAGLDRVQSKVAHLLHARCGCGRTGMLPGGLTSQARLLRRQIRGTGAQALVGRFDRKKAAQAADPPDRGLRQELGRGQQARPSAELPLPLDPRLADLDVGDRIRAHLVGIAFQDREIGFLALFERT